MLRVQEDIREPQRERQSAVRDYKRPKRLTNDDYNDNCMHHNLLNNLTQNILERSHVLIIINTNYILYLKLHLLQ